MTDTIGSLVARAAPAACAAMLVCASAAAQTPLANAPVTPQFMSRYDFHLSAAGLAVDDDRFTWDTHFGGDFDFIDYVHGRMFFLADYQALLGSEFRPFDPIQGNYTLEAAGSIRSGANEFMGALHHVSRHLGDRPKRFAIAWNELDARVLRRFAIGGSTLDARLEAGKVIARADVDYSWTGAVDLTLRRPVNPHLGVFGRVLGQTIGVIDASERGQQKGGRLEGGIRITGEGGALELMAGYEQVIDADPLEKLPRRWAYWGFRLVTK
jgi:hypothetical protein